MADDQKKRPSFAEQVAERLIDQLEKGTAPWQRPWAAGELQLPHNPVTDKPYRGFNSVWLLAQGQSDPRWMTYRQAAEAGGQVREGERGTRIQYFAFEGTRLVRDEDGKTMVNEDGEAQRETVSYERPRVMTHTVFNAAQIDGLPELALRETREAWQRHEVADAILVNSGINIEHSDSQGAFYRPASDTITLPNRDRFLHADSYYATATHELGHATGHSTRLDRDLSHPFGSKSYAREELRAEIASLMIGERLEMGHDPGQHAAYVDYWVALLKEKPTEIFKAAAEAEKIAELVTSLEHNRDAFVNHPLIAQAQQRRAGDEVSMSNETEKHERIHLNVPYVDKDRAKAAGARWDKEAKAWYAPENVAIEPLREWMGAKDIALNPIDEFAVALKDAGLIIDGAPIMDGELRRVPVAGDKGKEASGAYVGHLDGHPAGFIQNFKEGTKENWKSSNVSVALTDVDRLRLQAENQARLAERDRQRSEQNERVAARLDAERGELKPADPQHPYLVKKGLAGIAPLLAQDAAGNLVVPAHDRDGKTWTVQRIDGEGRKGFEPDGRLTGNYYVAVEPNRSLPNQPIIIAEGWATAATIQRAVGGTVVTAFTAGNLLAVAEEMRAQHPDRPIIIAGDNDHVKANELHPTTGLPKGNRGLDAAREAAEAVNGYAAVPQFDAADRGTDWNDWQRTHGDDELRKEMAAARLIADRRLINDREAMRDEPENIAMRIQQDVRDVQALVRGADGSLSASDAQTIDQMQDVERKAEHIAVNAPSGAREQAQAIEDAGLELGFER